MKSLLTILFLCATLLSAQTKLVKPIGQSGPENEILKIKKAISGYKGFSAVQPYDPGLSGLNGVIDTLSYRSIDFRTNFGMFGQDIMAQWFEATTDLTINAISFFCTDEENSAVSVKLVRLSWDKDQILETATSLGATWWGYYEASGNGLNDITPFQDEPDRTGVWVEGGSIAQQNQWGTPFAKDIWPDFGGWIPATAVLNEETWVSMDALDSLPEIKAGELFAVAVKNEGNTLDAGRTGLRATNNLGVPGFKFYRNGRLQTGTDYGWWTRLYTWDMRVAVNFTGDRAPHIELAEPVLATTLLETPRLVSATIIDDNPSGGPAGVASAQINILLNEDTTLVIVPMALVSGDSLNGEWQGEIPGYPETSKITWYVTATDILGNTNQTTQSTYHVFQPKNPTLLVMNGQKESGYPTDYYFGTDDFENFTPFYYEHDVWAYGPLTKELVANYTLIIEIATRGPLDINNEVIREWLEGNWNRDYMLAGDEWLGVQTRWLNQSWEEGSFHYDILGITYEYNDINYVVTGDQNKRSQVFTVPGSYLGDRLARFSKNVIIDSVTTGVDTLWYDPVYEIGVSNWLDGVDVTDDCDVFLKGVGIDGNIYNIGHYRRLPNGNQVAFFAYDPLSINASPYYWFGFSESSPQVEVLKHFGVYIIDNIDAVE